MERYDIERIGPALWVCVDTHNRCKPIAPAESYDRALSRADRHNCRDISAPSPRLLAHGDKL